MLARTVSEHPQLFQERLDGDRNRSNEWRCMKCSLAETRWQFNRFDLFLQSGQPFRQIHPDAG